MSKVDNYSREPPSRELGMSEYINSTARLPNKTGGFLHTYTQRDNLNVIGTFVYLLGKVQSQVQLECKPIMLKHFIF